MRNRKHRNKEIREKKYDPSIWSRLEVKELAYHDGMRYHCLNIFCYADGIELREIARMPSTDGLTYTPVLECKKCGTKYYGLTTPDIDALEIIQQYHEQRKRAEEERKQNTIARKEADAEKWYREEERREQEIREEISEHESELAGDITLPDIIGEPQKRNTRPDDEDTNGDIILPNILTY